MAATNTTSSRSGSPHTRNASDAFQTIRMPIEEPVTDLEEAVEKLKQCSTAELKEARRHHRRALEALDTGGYDALSEGTRGKLVERLHTNLEALNGALNALEEDLMADSDRSSPARSSSSPFRTLVSWLW